MLYRESVSELSISLKLANFKKKKDLARFYFLLLNYNRKQIAL